MILEKNEALILIPGQTYTVLSPADNTKFTEKEVMNILHVEALSDVIYIQPVTDYLENKEEVMLVWNDSTRSRRNGTANLIREDAIGSCVDKIYGEAIICHIELLPDVLVTE